MPYFSLRVERRQGYFKANYYGKRCVMIPRAEVERFIRGEIDFSKPPRPMDEK
jgi:hypothetical protein